nr:helix-turn-helix transcriptional regulator [Sporosarcina jiandibaonis]
MVCYTINLRNKLGGPILLTNRVRELRARFDLTQGELADRVGVTRQTIVSLEKGSYTPSLLLAMNIAEEFEMPIEEIFSKEEKK